METIITFKKIIEYEVSIIPQVSHKAAPTIFIILNHNILFIKKEIIIKIVAAQPTMLRVSMF